MVQVRQNINNKFRRDAWLEINLSNLEFNLNKLYQEFKKPLIPVLKADAYGHGASVIVKTLDAFDFIEIYGVASLDEALSLREATNKRIMILGVSPEWAIEEALENDIELTICDLSSAKSISEKASSKNKTINIHLKIDTGMNRIGFKASEFQNIIHKIKEMKSLNIASIFTHFADIDDLEFCKQQKQSFDLATQNLNYPKHLASSKAARLFKDDDSEFVRCGIELFGLENPLLKPLLSLHSRISFIKDINKGESVSYKRTWKSTQNTKIATLPIGYADGIPRALSNKITAYCKGQTIQQVGTITMDQMMFDLNNDANIHVGDLVELLGTHSSSVETWTKQIDTISYELVSILSLRLPKTYSR
jgi:alanine racemase